MLDRVMMSRTFWAGIFWLSLLVLGSVVMLWLLAPNEFEKMGAQSVLAVISGCVAAAISRSRAKELKRK